MNTNDTFGSVVNNGTSTKDACEPISFSLSSSQRWAVFTLGIPQTVLTITLNILILLTFVVNSSLRKAQHYNFLNLALCDLVIACVALPSRLTLDLYGCWPVPQAFCRLYKLLDWIATSEAASTVILIAVTRYRMITRGAVYQTEETSRKVLGRIFLTWAVNIFLYGPVQFVDIYTGVRITGTGQCNTEFFQFPWLGNLLVVTNNIIPPVVVIIIYLMMFLALRQDIRMVANTAPSVAVTKGSRAAKRGKELMLLTAGFLLTSCPVGIISVVKFAVDSLSVHRSKHSDSFAHRQFTSTNPRTGTGIQLLDWITTSEAAFPVILIAVTRYRMMTRGTVYNQEEASRKVISQIILTWITNILLYGPVQFVDKYTRISITGNILPPVIVVVIYAFVFHALRARTNKIAANPSNAQSAASSTRPKENRAAKEGRAMMLLTASFLLTSCPNGTISIAMFADNSLTIFQSLPVSPLPALLQQPDEYNCLHQ
ncbi:hypothetical protein RvY_00154 [Ramazzottius varieornatus]|uniref:G-protein coupled receptors family 1 profile domain-containing protein n=1 Tax=Ramazzottius varieornatus TaxID=947166 RepID=A0A1D1UFX2_RAMVA|nr:hypothetical protein RvY_00154 [Ramazzottius varieornatus]